MKRRTFLESSLAFGAALSLSGSRVLGANNDIRMGIIGLGSFVKIGGKGRKDAKDFEQIPGVRVVAVCDCDTDNLNYVVNDFKKQNKQVKAYTDFRKLLDDKDIDAVGIVTPNHWHSLMTIMACQAGKDVFVQKPSSHNIYEGRKMVEAAKKYNRIVQATHGPRNSGAIEEMLEYVWEGNLGEILYIHGINYRPRTSIGKVNKPQPIPESCDYDLWCGPAPKKPLMRKNLHYDWHWDWDTGNGDLGNMGIHAMDGCRWASRQNQLPERVISIGARLGYDDDGQTPNTMITLLDYEPAPIIFEVRGLPADKYYRLNLDEGRHDSWNMKSSISMDNYRLVRTGFVVQCQDGYVTDEDEAAFDNRGKKIKEFSRRRENTKENFIKCVRDRKAEHLLTNALDGHLSCGLVHLANISYRIGEQRSNDEIREVVKSDKQFSKSFERLENHLFANRVNMNKDDLLLGPILKMDPETEKFTGEFSTAANKLRSRKYREPFVVRENV